VSDARTVVAAAPHLAAVVTDTPESHDVVPLT